MSDTRVNRRLHSFYAEFTPASSSPGARRRLPGVAGGASYSPRQMGSQRATASPR